MSRLIYKSFIASLTVGTSYLIAAMLLKFIAINIIPLTKIPTFEKSTLFWMGYT